MIECPNFLNFLGQTHTQKNQSRMTRRRVEISKIEIKRHLIFNFIPTSPTKFLQMRFT